MLHHTTPTMNRQSTIHQQLESVTDIATLSPVSEDIIVSCIRERFMNDNIYTAVGTSALVAVNPHKYVPSNSDAVLHKYAAEYRDTSPDKTRLPPHIFQLANNAYYHMRRTAQDQSILFTYVPFPYARGVLGCAQRRSDRLCYFHAQMVQVVLNMFSSLLSPSYSYFGRTLMRLPIIGMTSPTTSGVLFP